MYTPTTTPLIENIYIGKVHKVWFAMDAANGGSLESQLHVSGGPN
jgi:hypothetical protein